MVNYKQKEEKEQKWSSNTFDPKNNFFLPI